jgi:hypothetical protein
MNAVAVGEIMNTSSNAELFPTDAQLAIQKLPLDPGRSNPVGGDLLGKADG